MPTTQEEEINKEKNMNQDDIQDYKRIVSDGLATLYMDGKFGGNGYQGMVLDGLRTNILNLLDDCDNDIEKFKDAVSKIFEV